MAFQSPITRQVNAQGTNEERQLIARWRRDIDGFLGAFGAGQLTPNYLMAFEFSTYLGLGMTVMQAPTSPDPSMALRARHLLPEPARSVAEDVVAANADCQITQQLLPTSCRYTLRLRNRMYAGYTAQARKSLGSSAPPDGRAYPGRALQARFGCPAPPFSEEAIHSWQLSDNVSFWLSANQVPERMEKLRETTLRLESRFRVPLVPHVAELLEHYTWEHDNRWMASHSGVVLRNVPADVAVSLLSSFGLKHFRYFAPYRPYRSFGIVLDESEQVEKCVLVP